MSGLRRAAIDVGTNSVKLLIAEIQGKEIHALCEASNQTRLGQGFYQTRHLQPEAIALTAQAVADYVRQARAWACETVRVFSTSVAREAVNAAALVEAIQQRTGIAVEIISGAQEADWVFRGVLSNAALPAGPLLLLDVGGGSTEFILGWQQRRLFSHSFPLGSVRLLETFPISDPPTPAELHAVTLQVRGLLTEQVAPVLTPAWQREIPRPAAPPQLVGTGGAATILARMAAQLHTFDRAQIEATRISAAWVTQQTEQLWRLPLAERRQLIGLPPSRADVILTGAVIYQAIMECLQFRELRVSTRGLRFAAVLDAR
ncbi:MAG TPA: Ppx/GppA family phosphatase [Verrucomicrobiota bacterium]|nr:Ppx/GppA family phosphatase [Verrucomicrobiota bacterium]HNT13439.1 Ppx/GppA family phosphatase [Verrucomicrobiota bacterium]